MDHRIRAAEEQIAHLTRATEDLSDVVARQADEIDRLTRRVALLLDKMAGPEDGGIVLTDQRPPHW